MHFPSLIILLYLFKNGGSQNCNSCSPSFLKLVARNNTPAPIIMGTFQENGCQITVVACDIPECSDAVLDSYYPNGTFKRVTNEEGTVWPHLELECSENGEYVWDGEVQSEFSCYSDDCFIPTTSSESTVSTTFTVTLNGTQTTVTPFSDSTTSFFSTTSQDFTTSSIFSTTTESCTDLCQDINNIMIDENVKFEKPRLLLRIPNPGWETCGDYTVVCQAEPGQKCESVMLIDIQNRNLVAEDPFLVQFNISCDGTSFGSNEESGFVIFGTLMCKYKNCQEYSTTTVGTVSTTVSTVSTVGTVSTTRNLESTSTVDITSTVDFTTSIASTTTESCTDLCQDINNIMIDEKVKFEKPRLLTISPHQNEDSCSEFTVICQPDPGHECDSILLYEINTNGIMALREDNILVQYNVSCADGHFESDGTEVLGTLMCKYKNCVEYSTSTVPTTVTSTVIPTEEKSCATCKIEELFDYANRTDMFQPWFYDIETPDNCLCKGYDVSCELYDVDTCDFHNLMYLSDDNLEYSLAESTINKVNGQIYCQNNGEFEFDGRLIKEIYCKSSNCRKS